MRAGACGSRGAWVRVCMHGVRVAAERYVIDYLTHSKWALKRGGAPRLRRGSQGVPPAWLAWMAGEIPLIACSEGERGGEPGSFE